MPINGDQEIAGVERLYLDRDSIQTESGDLRNLVTMNQPSSNPEVRYDEIWRSQQIFSLKAQNAVETGKSAKILGITPAYELREKSRREDAGIRTERVQFIDRGK